MSSVSPSSTITTFPLKSEEIRVGTKIVVGVENSVQTIIDTTTGTTNVELQ